MIAPDLIHEIIDSFYQKATFDFLIGYHFRKIEDFDTHIPRIATFWELQLNGRMSRKEDMPFNLFRAHEPLGIKKGELGRWVTLFRETLNEYVAKKLLSEQDREEWMKKVAFFEVRIEQRLIQPS